MKDGLYVAENGKLRRFASNSGHFADPEWQHRWAALQGKSIVLREHGRSVIQVPTPTPEESAAERERIHRQIYGPHEK